MESNRIGIGEARDVRHDVVRTPGLEDREAGACENFQQPCALGCVRSREFVVVGPWKVKSARAGMLERRGRADSQEIVDLANGLRRDLKSTRLNSSHSQISYAVFCLKKKKKSEHH